MDEDVIRAEIEAGYARAADDLRAPYDAISSAEFLAPVAAFLPDGPARILDVGAGTGRDAHWFAGQGHEVTAVDPVPALRVHQDLRWITDSLPDLAGVSGVYDLILLTGVWQHVPPAARADAMARLASLLAMQGQIIMALRHGAGAASRPVFAIDVEDTVRQAKACGLCCKVRVTRGSMQPENMAAGVHWTWIVLQV